MSKGNSDPDPIGIIYKMELRDTLQAHAFLLRDKPEALEALFGIVLAYGLGRHVNLTQFLAPQKISGTVEGQVKRLEGGNDGK